MIVVQLQGGLGNQMFQYACGRAVALRAKKNLVLDLRCYMNHMQHRHYGLHHFNIQAQTIYSLEQLRIICKQQQIDKIPLFIEPHFHFAPQVAALRDSVALVDGYWQSERYFYDVAATIRQDFVPISGSISVAAQQLSQIVGKTLSIAVHVRRGDYVSVPLYAKVHGALPLRYYQAAFQAMQSKFPSAHFFVFSDCPKWCRSAFAQYTNLTVVENGPEQKAHEDLWLMSQCNHHIIANSSYSWWSAWLNPKPDKMVIAPARWFRGADHDTRDLFPASWHQI